MVTVVRGAQELQAAVAAGARDIEIRSHLNLTALEPPEDPDGFDTPSHLMRVDSAIRSMRVRPRTCRHVRVLCDPLYLFRAACLSLPQRLGSCRIGASEISH